MSIINDGLEYENALKKAHTDFPFLKKYPNTPNQCKHDFSFIVFCDGGNWDIARCRFCGEERVVTCTFDDDYN